MTKTPDRAARKAAAKLAVDRLIQKHKESLPTIIKSLKLENGGVKMLHHRTVKDPEEIRTTRNKLVTQNTSIADVAEVVFGRDAEKGFIVLVTRKSGSAIEFFARAPKKTVKPKGLSI